MFGTGRGFTADEINSGTLNAGLIKILGTDQFFWNADNIHIVDPANPLRQIRMGRYDGEHYGIGFTTNGGETWGLAFGFNGIDLTQSSIPAGNVDGLGDAITENLPDIPIIDKIESEYYLSTSPLELLNGSWSTVPPAWENGKYYWIRTKTTYVGDKPPDYTNAACITGQAGQTGSTGTGISSITEEYYLSTSKTEQLGDQWRTAPLAWSAGMYMWTRSKIVYTNPASTVYTTAICDTAWEVVNDLSPQVTDAESLAAEAAALLRDMADDNKLTPSEKIRIYGEWATIQAEKVGIDTQIAFYGLTSSAERIAHDSAYTALADALNILFLNMTETSSINGESIRGLFIGYFLAKQNVMNKMDNAEKARLDDIKNRTEALESDQEVTRNFMRIGDVKLGDGTIVYGIAIGKDVSTLNPDGTIKHTNASSISTATDYSFLVNGVKVGEFSNSGLKTDNVNTPSLEMGGKWRWRAGTDGRLTLRPM